MAVKRSKLAVEAMYRLWDGETGNWARSGSGRSIWERACSARELRNRMIQEYERTPESLSVERVLVEALR